MDIPSVSGMFQAKLGVFGARGSDGDFSRELASALERSSAADGEPFFKMTIVPSPETEAGAQAQAPGWTPPQAVSAALPASSAADAYGKVYSLTGAFSLAAGPSTKAAELVAWAKQFVGTPYVRGGEDLLKGADCSGFTQSVFKHFGVNLPRSAYRQSQVGTPVDPDKLQSGDLMFFKTDDYAPVTHVAIYVGDGKILHASSVKTGVIISKLKKNWQTGDFVCAKRML
jgi:cell wall-associated NlpC family hydrolase